jgi:hypothetical protein
MADLECPYCEADNDVCHDDGFGYSEDTAHEMMCHSCEKNFVFFTTIHFYYEPKKADCLNGEPHKINRKEYPNLNLYVERCRDCDYERQGYQEVVK